MLRTRREPTDVTVWDDGRKLAVMVRLVFSLSVWAAAREVQRRRGEKGEKQFGFETEPGDSRFSPHEKVGLHRCRVWCAPHLSLATAPS